MVIIDPYRGGDDIGYTSNGIIEKDFNLMISKYINDRLNNLGIDTFLTRDSDTNLNINQRGDLIKDLGDNKNVIALSNRLNNGDESGIEIVYSLKNNNTFPNKLEKEFKERGLTVNKVYQRRDENDTSMDYDELLKRTGNVETIIVNYGYVNNVNDANLLKNEYIKYAESIIKVLTTQFGVPYTFESNDIYIVKKGDSLYSIAKKYNTTVDNLMKENNLKSTLLNIGDVLKIPSNNLDSYIVQKGDTLYSISKKFNISVNELKSLNNLTSNLLSIGQVLKIKPNIKYYTVQKGDTLYSISRKYNISVNELKNLNNLSSNLLNIGQVLIVG